MIWKEKIETEKLNQTILKTNNKVLIGGCEEIKEVEEDMYNSWVNSGENTEKFCTEGTFVLSNNNTAHQSMENSPKKDFLKKICDDKGEFKMKKEKIKRIEITPIGYGKNSSNEEYQLMKPKLIFEENSKKKLDDFKKNYVKKKTVSSSNYLNVIKNKKNRHLSNDTKKLNGKFTPDFKTKNFKKIKKSLEKKKKLKKGLFEKLQKNYHYKTMNSLKKQNLNYKNKQPSIERKKDLKFTKLKKKYSKKKLKSSRENINPIIDCESVKSQRVIKKKKGYKSINIKERNIKNYKFEKFDGRFKSFLENTFNNENSLLKSDPSAMTEFKFYKEKNKSFKNNI